jgi:hypothetical protein
MPGRVAGAPTLSHMESPDLPSPDAPGASNPIRVVVIALSVLAAAGAAVMAIAHMGVYVPVPGAPDTARVILPAAIAFSVGTLALVVLLYGLLTRRRWAWLAGLVVHALVVLGAGFPVRGWPSVVAIVVSGLAILLLLTPGGRRIRAGG